MKTTVPVALTSLLALAAPAQAQWTVEFMTADRFDHAVASVDGLVFFSGGFSTTTMPSDVVDIYDTNTSSWSGAVLSVARGGVAAAAVGHELLIGGGAADWAGPNFADVDVYNSSTATWSTATLSAARSHLAAAAVGTKVLFGGGRGSAVVDIYDQSTGTWSTATLSQARGDLAATTVGTKVIFAGGWGAGPSDVVDIYDDSTGAWSTATLSVARERLSATTVGTKAIFAGGGSASLGIYDTVDIFDDSTGTWSTATLSAPREYLGATTVGDQAFFAGGWNGIAGANSDVVDIYDDSTGTWSSAVLSTARWGVVATSEGSRAFFAGGAGSTVIDIYEASGPGTNYCVTSTNSTGNASTMGSAGSPSIAANDLVLIADGMPGQPGIFIASGASAQIPFFNGFLCVSPTGLQRFSSVATPVGGVVNEAVDYPSSVPGGLNVVPGGSTFYQRWFRDPAAGGGSANFSDGLEIVHGP